MHDHLKTKAELICRIGDGYTVPTKNPRPQVILLEEGEETHVEIVR